MSNSIKVGITHGDINGIGYEVILKMLEDQRIGDLCTIVVYGSAKIAGFYRKALELQQVQLNRIDSASDAREGTFNIVNVVDEDVKIEPGVAASYAGEAAFAALEAAVADLRAGKIDVLVTAPIDKHTIQSPTFTFPGHTEYLEASLGDASTAIPTDEATETALPAAPGKALMILCTENLRVALVTAHIPLARIATELTKELVLEKIEAFHASLRRDFGIHSPRIAVLSLNPHAGENGLLGTEETEIIGPAIAEAMQKKIMAFGPYPSDGFFGSGNYTKFDGILAMYHDQGLAPFKTLAMDAGVNFTAGLPYVRTSPDHGTGYDIAGKGLASEESIRASLYMAIDIYRNRRREDEAYRHPLRKQYHNKGKDNEVLDLKSE